jgi:hypothetical protein
VGDAESPALKNAQSAREARWKRAEESSSHGLPRMNPLSLPTFFFLLFMVGSQDFS